MDLHPSVGYKPRIPGELYRQPEIGACGLISFNLVWMARVSEVLPVFASDNAVDRAGQRWCGRSGCGWKSIMEFGVDKTRTEKQGRTIYKRYCRSCHAALMREERNKLRLWKPYPEYVIPLT